MRILLYALVVIGCVALPLLTGCGDGLAQVSGMVQVDGKPLPEGEIIFEEVDRTKQPAVAKISDGAYTIRVAPGNKRILITASRPTKIPDPVMGAAARESMIADEFNVDTKLTHQVEPGEHTGVDFEVAEKP